MKEMRMGESETRFAKIIWQTEPITTKQMIKLCEQELGWKRTTTYTVLKNLCEKGIFQVQDSIVTSLVSRKEFFATQSEKFVELSFDGSLPQFLVAFAERKALTQEEVDAIQQFINSFGEDTPS